MESFVRRRELLKQEIYERQLALSYLEELQSAVKNTMRPDSWFIEPMEKAWFCCPLSVQAEGSSDAWWKISCTMPEIWHCTQWVSSEDLIRGGEPRSQIWGTLLTDEALVHSEQFEVLAEIPPSRCFVHYHSILTQCEESSPPRFSEQIWNGHESLDILREHNLTPRGDLYQQRLFLTHEEEGTLVHILTRIPLK